MKTRYSTYKKYAPGGDMGLATKIGQSAAVVGSLADGLWQPNEYGKRPLAGNLLSSAGSMAATGASIGGPVGAAIGGGLGLIKGIFDNGAQKRQERKLKAAERFNSVMLTQNQTAARLTADPNAVSGNVNAGYYAYGGDTTATAKPVMELKPKVPKLDMAEELRAINAGKTGMSKAQRDSLAATFNRSEWLTTVDKTGYQVKPPKKLATGGRMKVMAENGEVAPLSSTAVEFHGPSHEDGGIQIPSRQAEVEGEETAAGNYVFSERLGFAKAHKKLATAQGKIEGKTLSPERVNSLKLIADKTNQLKQSQEFLKLRLNLQ